MNYGRFFEFDFESSYLRKGIVVFNYRWLQQKPTGKRKSPRYPIYLVFTPESISFNLHYYEDETDNGKWNSHYHNTIIELRLSSNIDVTKGLSETLNNTYYASFPMSSNEPLRKIVLNSFDVLDCPMPGFSKMEVFEPETKDAYQGNNDTHLLRKIILDFLYDLEFTDVFKNVAFYDELSVKLKDIFIFSALLNKLRYYYYRTVICADEIVGCKVKEIKEWDKNSKFFFEHYAKAEQEWVFSILDDRAMKTFHESPWFDESYQELDQVYYSRRLSSWKKSEPNERTIPYVLNISQIPSLIKDDLKAKQAYLKGIGVTEKDSFGLTVSNMLNLIRIRQSSEDRNKDSKSNSFDKAVNNHLDTAKTAAKWNVSHYHFIGLARLWGGDPKTLICSMFMHILLIIITCGVYNKLYFSIPSDLKGWNYIATGFIFFALLVPLSNIIRKKHRSTWGMGAMAMMMPRMLAAVVAAWFTMGMSEDLFKHFAEDGNLSLNVPAIVILFLMTLLFVFYESRQIKPYDKRRNLIFSSLIVNTVAYIYSVIVGAMVYDFFGKAFMNPAYTGNIADKCKFILQFSFFASFIGIFLQLMFQGKSVTESK